MKCKNCEHEFEAGKFCPECGFPVTPKTKSRQEEAFELLKDTNERLRKLDEQQEERKKKIEERKKKHGEEANTNAGESRTRGILDIF